MILLWSILMFLFHYPDNSPNLEPFLSQDWLAVDTMGRCPSAAASLAHANPGFPIHPTGRTLWANYHIAFR